MFIVDPSAQVLEALARLKPAERRWFTEIRSILAENPYRFRDIIQQNIDARGRIFYQYYDGVLPLVLLYRVYPP